MAKSRVSIYLVKEGITANEEIVKTGSCPYVQEIKGIGTFYSRISRSVAPKWVEEIFGDAVDSTNLCSSSVSAVLLVPLCVSEEKLRTFALTFGYGRTLLEPYSLEERFGLKTALNIAENNSVRKIQRTTVAGNALKASEQLPRTSSISEFTIDIDRDLLDGVTVSVPKGEGVLSGNVTGSDALSASIEINVHNMREVLSEIFELYETDGYRQSFSWIDRISAVKPRKVIDELNVHALSLIREKSQDIWMAVPEIVKWEDVQGFRITGDRGLHQDISIDWVVESLTEPLESFEQLGKRTVKEISTDGHTVISQWPSTKCLFGEMEYGGQHYCLNGGKWFRIESDFARVINADYAETPLSTMVFPEWDEDMRESDYNRKLASMNRGGEHNRALMDAKNITYGGGASKIELCDVLIDDGTFLHVKKYSGSAVLSHLFNQGLVSAQLIKTDDGFLGKAADMLAKENPDFPLELSHDCVNRVVYVIGTKSGLDRPQIPFFSKLALYYAKSQLKLMNVPMEIKGVHYTGK